MTEELDFIGKLEDKYEKMKTKLNCEEILSIESLKHQIQIRDRELEKFRPFTSAYEMKKEIERLNNIINKAIEYIENDLSHATSNGKLHRKHLIDILKGVDKE